MLTTTKSFAAPVAQFDGLVGRKFSKAKSIAARLGICSRTIFRWADAGKIARHKINERVVLFDEAEVLAFIESARASSPSEQDAVYKLQKLQSRTETGQTIFLKYSQSSQPVGEDGARGED